MSVIIPFLMLSRIRAERCSSVIPAIILIPILDYYNILPTRVDDDEVYPIKNYEKDLIMKMIDKIEKRKTV